MTNADDVIGMILPFISSVRYSPERFHFELIYSARIQKCKCFFFFFFAVYYIVYKPAHDNTYKMACEPSEDSDQPGHQSLRCPHEESLGP